MCFLEKQFSALTRTAFHSNNQVEIFTLLELFSDALYKMKRLFNNVHITVIRRVSCRLRSIRFNKIKASAGLRFIYSNKAKASARLRFICRDKTKASTSLRFHDLFKQNQSHSKASFYLFKLQVSNKVTSR